MWYHNIKKMTKPKKTPAQKKATKQSKKGTDMNGSIVSTLAGGGVSTVSIEEQMPSTSTGDTASKQSDKSDLILAYLEKLDHSNQALTRRVADLEVSKSTSSTPHSTRTQSQTVLTALFSLNSQQLLQADQGQPALSQPMSQAVVPPKTNAAVNLTQLVTQGAAVSSAQGQNQQAKLPMNSSEQIQKAFNSDGVIPSLNALRQNNTISQSVNQVITLYKQ